MVIVLTWLMKNDVVTLIVANLIPWPQVIQLNPFAITMVIEIASALIDGGVEIVEDRTNVKSATIHICDVKYAWARSA